MENTTTDREIILAARSILKLRGNWRCCHEVSYFKIGDLNNFEFYSASNRCIGEIKFNVIAQYLELPCP